MHIAGGAIYNHYVHRLMDASDQTLENLPEVKRQRSWTQTIIDALKFEDWSLKLQAASDLLHLRRDPGGPMKEKIGWKVAAWRAEK